MTDWRNVGNWHWKEKNCFDWAKQYFENTLTGTEVSENGYSARVTSVDGVSGDVDLNIRKGKLIAIYDVELKLSWSATKDADGNKDADTLTGSVTIPEVAHDTDDYVYDISSTNASADKLHLKDFVRQKLTPEITRKLEAFTDVLKKENGSDMYIAGKDDNAGSGAGTPASTDPRPAKDPKDGKQATSGSSDVSVAKTANATFNTVSINQTVELMCSAEDIFATLTDPQLVSVWTRAPAEIQPKENTQFKLFGGHIEGKIIKLVPGKLIEQTWRVATWPAGHFSNAKFEFDQLSSSTRVSLKQTGVPFNEEDATKANWDRYYWNSIKGSFG
ncbi:Co-chaperone [Coemansia spiralis]|uniref:Co-chaperone n=2 Tax=Coemansia TaxID=4863 RepID=A0A9W8G153_9FUNG|nr:Co-chaperone [Coemansia umbellata]KAJ2618980.1 Co-chaperone [Coemansia sp. RSA 1358]KAJ2669703.1 Co-chaperone [Coemansia spiralis]